MATSNIQKEQYKNFHKEQLKNHRDIFSTVEPVLTSDPFETYTQQESPKQKRKIISLVRKLFSIFSKQEQIDVRINDYVSDKIMEEKIQKMNSKEILEFLNTDDLSKQVKFSTCNNDSIRMAHKIKDALQKAREAKTAGINKTKGAKSIPVSIPRVPKNIISKDMVL